MSHQNCQEPDGPGSLSSFSAFPVQKAGKLSSLTFSLHGRGPGQALMCLQSQLDMGMVGVGRVHRNPSCHPKHPHGRLNAWLLRPKAV